MATLCDHREQWTNQDGAIHLVHLQPLGLRCDEDMQSVIARIQLAGLSFHITTQDCCHQSSCSAMRWGALLLKAQPLSNSPCARVEMRQACGTCSEVTTEKNALPANRPSLFWTR